jgi:hypothetical protein
MGYPECWGNASFQRKLESSDGVFAGHLKAKGTGFRLSPE